MKLFTTILTALITLVIVTFSFAMDAKRPFATAESYFDVATGHRYIKNADATYSEFTKRGKLFRASVSPYLPLLTTNKYIREISQNCFMIYEKSGHQVLKVQILPASSGHPKGWLAKNAIECVKKDPVMMDPGYTSAATSNCAPKKMATGQSYLDVATGHKYIRNDDATYSEYTKRGELFRTSVSPHLPLLTTNKHIRQLDQHCYLLYEKKSDDTTQALVLPSDHKHPAGWFVEKILISMVR